MPLRILLSPLSLLYGFVTYVRNKLYDRNCLKSSEYKNVCVISVGNITVGGTGKTPHVEYLARFLSGKHRVAILSRGYKRKTKGFTYVEDSSTADRAGDEPYQMKLKLPELTVAVDADRINGISEILRDFPQTDLILLDDAFQYREIKPAFSILLCDYNRPMYRDSMLPGGRLREWACFAKRADMMMVTKTPHNITESEQQEIVRNYAPVFNKKIFFTTILYGNPVPLFPNARPLTNKDLEPYAVLLVTGIARPEPFREYVRSMAPVEGMLSFPDHHRFSGKDINNILDRWEKIGSPDKIILTTEKDAVRMKSIDIPDRLKEYIYYIPIEIDFIGNGKEDFNWMVEKLTIER